MNMKQKIVAGVTGIWIIASLIQGYCFFPIGPKDSELLSKQINYCKGALLPLGIPIVIGWFLIYILRDKKK